MPALKALLYVLIAVFGSGAALFTATTWSSDGVWNVAILAVGALAVWLKANTPSQPWAKFLVGLFAAGATVLVSAWTDGHIDAVEVQQIVLAILAAASVGAAANTTAIRAEHVSVDNSDIRHSA